MLGVTTEPDLLSAPLDQPVAFKLAAEQPAAPRTIGESEAETGGEGTATRKPPNVEPLYQIGQLPAATNTPVSIPRTATVNEAVTIMLSKNYSQLPVMQGEREVHGIISWRSIGRALHFGHAPQAVRDCLEDAHEVAHNAPLFDAIPMVIQHEYVLVRNHSKVITGIVTTADLSEQFRDLAEPFLLIGEIEHSLRKILDFCFNAETLSAMRESDDGSRKVTCASDLTFGEYKTVLENPDNWAQLGVPVDRALFIAQLERVRLIRNDVMHFRAARLTADDLCALRECDSLVHFVATALR